MKEMIYQNEIKREVLDTGFCYGYLYYILSLGVHPTAYIKIPENSCINHHDVTSLEVHGRNNLYGESYNC